MNRIIILDDTLVSKIAAGEVVERPASVVKELIENSIDAGAKSIHVEVADGGKKLIRVSDDGCGMNSDEALLSLERHSTSKIRNADDLFNITTLGFRGEALPSIASISRMEMVTRDAKSEAGIKLVVEGGKLKKKSSTGCPVGTTITIEDIFFNTPARLKFQKSTSTELANVIETVSKMILSHPEISFSLRSDGKNTLSSIGSGNLIDAVASVYGSDMAKSMVEVKGESVRGYISQPVITKSDRYGENFFVNGRFVRNFLISRALEDCYRALIPQGRYPIAALFIVVNPRDVDVNVHPTKREIKFSNPDITMKAVASAVSEALSSIRGQTSQSAYQPAWGIKAGGTMPESLQIQETQGADAMYKTAPQAMNAGPVIFQHNLTYIIYSEAQDLVIIDQHAAHERIMYEKIKGRVIPGTQSLLIPKTIELEPSVFSTLSSNMETLRELGFDIEVFGKNSIMVRGIPAVMKVQNVDTVISDILSEISSSFKIKSIDERKDAIFKMMACKAAVKAGDRLTYDEMSILIGQLMSTGNPMTCPHGRPTMVRIARSEFEKMFGR